MRAEKGETKKTVEEKYCRNAATSFAHSLTSPATAYPSVSVPLRLSFLETNKQSSSSLTNRNKRKNKN